MLHTGASSSQTVDERVGHSTPDCANAAGAVAIGPDSGGKPSQPQPAPATQARISVARRPTSDQAWRRMVEWASDPAQSGEPFAVRLLSRKWANGSSATLARGSCSAKGECALRNCKFAITATYDAARKQLVFAKQNPHRPQSFCALSWTRAGFKVASTVEHMPVPPGRQEVRERVREWCTNAGAHMEPFPLVLHEKQGNAGTALYRGVCRPQSPCGGPPRMQICGTGSLRCPKPAVFHHGKEPPRHTGWGASEHRGRAGASPPGRTQADSGAAVGHSLLGDGGTGDCPEDRPRHDWACSVVGDVRGEHRLRNTVRVEVQVQATKEATASAACRANLWVLRG